MKGGAKKYRKDFYAAQFIPNISKVRNSHRREHCSANRNQINKIGISQGQQVRIVRPLAKGGSTLAVYTVSDIHDQERNTVYVGYKDPKDLQARLELSDTNPFRGKVDAKVVATGLTDAEAEAYSEFVEHLIDNGYNSKLIVIAPHGGYIEEHTDKQAERVCAQLPERYVSAWICKGFKQGGGAYNRWHITSTDINEESFPKLKSIIGRHFEYSIAFHGWDEDSICIGGSMPTENKQKIKEAIVNAVSGYGIPVEMDEDRTCPGDFNGNAKENIVNRLSSNGLQIEQSKKARLRFGEKIADAVADILDPMIKV
jgi:phage replication-related protein YjqB (UPF0714/DUF867 family)